MKSGIRACGREKTRSYCNMIADTVSLDKKCAAIDAVVAKRRKQLEGLADYCKGMIYACVTGKKEVAA